ncbi:MAG: S-adenosylmethionine:tRNA ribosyltransferase-isomerase [Flavisolibacter sp.]
MKIKPGNIYISDYNYDLPHERIAEVPLSQRDHSKLLVFDNGHIMDSNFENLTDFLPEESTLILNNTRVIEARLLFQKTTGGVIEIFCLEPHVQSIEQSLSRNEKTEWLCLIGGASKWKPGLILEKELFVGDLRVILSAKYCGKKEDSFIIEFSWQPEHFPFIEILHLAGVIPLPPYIKREATEVDKERYQTVFSRHEGSVAAPTAALHFTPAIFEKLAAKKININYITLHVGAGTFKPVKSETLATHNMHREPFTVSKKLLLDLINAKTVIAVGTTSLRTLESLYWLGIKLINGLLNEEWKIDQWEAYEMEKSSENINTEKSLQSLVDWMEQHHQTEIHCFTGMIIVPGYRFRIPKALITNFHQPKSTLLLLVSAFVGEDWKKIYQHAMDNEYRFLSYGDSSLLWKREEG